MLRDLALWIWTAPAIFWAVVAGILLVGVPLFFQLLGWIAERDQRRSPWRH